MPQKIVVSLVVLAALTAAGCFIRNIFAQAIVHDPTTQPAVSSDNHPASPLDFTMNDIDGKPVNLANYRGKVVMIVNVASKCGFTPQYTGLEKLYTDYADKGLVILGFPANNFKSQEPGTDADIKTFCSNKYNVTFPMMSKISVKGDDKAPLYKLLTETPGDFEGDIAWNFTKFIIDQQGNLIARFAPATKPTDPQLVAVIEKALTANPEADDNLFSLHH